MDNALPSVKAHGQIDGRRPIDLLAQISQLMRLRAKRARAHTHSLSLSLCVCLESARLSSRAIVNQSLHGDLLIRRADPERSRVREFN